MAEQVTFPKRKHNAKQHERDAPEALDGIAPPASPETPTYGKHLAPGAISRLPHNNAPGINASASRFVTHGAFVGIIV